MFGLLEANHSVICSIYDFLSLTKKYASGNWGLEQWDIMGDLSNGKMPSYTFESY